MFFPICTYLWTSTNPGAQSCPPWSLPAAGKEVLPDAGNDVTSCSLCADGAQAAPDVGPLLSSRFTASDRQTDLDRRLETVIILGSLHGPLSFCQMPLAHPLPVLPARPSPGLSAPWLLGSTRQGPSHPVLPGMSTCLSWGSPWRNTSGSCGHTPCSVHLCVSLIRVPYLHGC